MPWQFLAMLGVLGAIVVVCVYLQIEYPPPATVPWAFWG